jgi:alcohol dehydrogenase class IV
MNSNQTVYYNIDSLEKVLLNTNKHKILLVTGKNSYKKINNEFNFSLALEKFQIAHFFDFNINPKYEDLLKGLDLKMNFNPDIILAVGGGSVIDMAKLINLFDTSSQIDNYIKFGNLSCKEELSKLIVIPTTSGSGSEATHFAVLYRNKIKYSVASNLILPPILILDFKLTRTNSYEQSLYSALDAFCQANESLWSVQSNTYSHRYSIISIKESLSVFVNYIDFNSDKNRKSMQLGAYYSGKAINISKTNAPHALSYFLTERYSIPHGLAVFLVFEKISTSLFQCLDDNLKAEVDLVYSSFGFTSLENCIIYLKSLIPEYYSLSQIVRDSRDRELHISSVNIERLNNSPIKFRIDELIDILYEN